MTHSTGVSISCFKDEVPSFVAAEMRRIYEHLFSSLENIQIYSTKKNINTYVVKDKNIVVTLFLFRIEGKTVYVLNELIKLHNDDIEIFSSYIFHAFPAVYSIKFSAVRVEITKLSFFYRQLNSCENSVLKLPDSVESYLSSLGKSTRRNIINYTNRLKKNFPDFSVQFLRGNEVSEHHIKEIVRLKLARMATKKKASGIDERSINQIMETVKNCDGMVTIGTIDGQICCGQISYRIGRNYFLSIISHDEKYNDFSLGTLCCYLTIAECIRQNGNEFHFLWGREEYKYRLLGTHQDLDDIHVFRSPLKMILVINSVLKTESRACLRHAKLWLLAPENRTRPLCKFLTYLGRKTQSIWSTKL